MATLKQAKEWIRKGKKVFRESERGHIYSIKDGKYICSCGKDVDWNNSMCAKDFVIYKRPNKYEKIIAEDCPECFTKLDGNYCNYCKIGWKFANCEEGVVDGD